MARMRGHDWGFWLYAVAGACVAFGLIVWPVWILALPLLAVVVRRYRWPADLGLLLGFAAFTLLVAASGVEGAVIWAAVGFALAAGSTLAFWWLRCRVAGR
jgi:hypothetical protein